MKGNYVFLNDLNKGVHIIDFSNPAAPQNVGFVTIPGNVDIAVRGNYMYADCYTDLVTIDISDAKNIKLNSYIEGVFPHRIYDAAFYPDSSKIITSWTKVDTIVRHRYNENGNWLKQFSGRSDMLFASASSQASSTNPSGNGTGGSLARFALYNNRMYTVSNSDLKIFNTTNTAAPSYAGTVNFQQGNIETIFPYQNKLFIGSQNGMYIYSLSNPDAPQQLAQVTHIRSCDPVIADDPYAYVTLRGGAVCGGFTNQLDVLDITNITSPFVVKSYPLSGPAGLSKDGNILMVCDGNEGLKFMNAANPAAITMLGRVTGIVPDDVIAMNGIALTVARDGIYFINYTNPLAPVVLSKLTVSN